MQLGIFAKTYSRPTLDATLDAVAADGLRCVQFNFACCGLPTLPDHIDAAQLAAIRHALGSRGIAVAAVSGTFNLIHPDPARRAAGLRRLPLLAEAARELGAPMVTLCTGSRDPKDMWKAHPGNAAPDAWTDLLTGLGTALETTASTGIAFGIEPELANVVDSARACRRLLDEFRTPRLKVVIDGANLLATADLQCQDAVFAEAFELLGADIGLAHAKEIGPDGHADGRGPGAGILDWGAFLRHLYEVRFDGPLVMHGLDEPAVPSAMAFLGAQI